MSRKPIIIAAAATVQAADGSKLRTFKVSPAYAGGELRVTGFAHPVVVDLAGLSVDERLPANLDHSPDKRVGHVVTATNDGRKLLLSGVVSAASESAAEFVSSASTGFPWQASVEVRPLELVDVRAGESVVVNGRTFRGPIQVARKSTLIGIAFVSRGADAQTKVLVANQSRGASTMEVSGEFTGSIQGTVADPNQATADPGMSTDPAAAVKAERQRVATIEATCGGDWEQYAGRVATIKAQAMSGSISLDKMREEIVQVIRDQRPRAPGICASSRDMGGDVIQAALCQTLGLVKAAESYGERTNEAAHRTFQGRLGLQQVLLMAASENGYQCRPGDKVTRSNLRTILAHAVPSAERMIHAAGMSTVSLPGILSNVANKELLAGYEDEDQSWKEISSIKSVPDFKQATSYRLLDNAEYELLPKGGKIKHGAMGEESYTRQVRTYAKMFALTREDIINDDLSAFDDLRTRLGRGAARKFNNLFWSTFINNASFFTSGRGNYISGATSNLAVDGIGLEEGILAFRGLRTPAADGAKRVSGKPEILLVPPELEFVARRLYQSTNVNTGGAATATAVPDANIYQGMYRPIVVDYLSDSDFTGYSATAWYLFRSPTLLAPMAVSFLDGIQTPTVEQADADFDELGIMFRGYHDFGVDFAEYLAGVKSKGSA